MKKIVIFVLLFSGCPSCSWAQVPVLLRTAEGSISFSTRYGAPKSDTCSGNDCVLQRNYGLECSYGVCKHNAELYAGNLSVSDRQTYADSLQWGTSSSEYRMHLYAKVPPGARVKTKLLSGFSLYKRESFTNQVWQGNVNCSGGITFENTSFGGGVYVSSGTAPTGRDVGISGTLAVEASSAAFPANYIQSGEDRYYYVGTVRLSGLIGINPGTWWNGPSATAEARFNFQAQSIDVRYVGKALSKIDSTDNQKARVNAQLPTMLTVKVADGETGTPYGGAPITFSLADPAKGGHFAGGGNSITVGTLPDGTASAAFTFGASAGEYRINAACPASICTSGAAQVTFRATAFGNAVACSTCTLWGGAGQELPNPFIFRVLDMFDNKPVSGAEVKYSVIGFIAPGGQATAQTHGAEIVRLLPPGGLDANHTPYNASDQYGFARAYLKLGTELGTYIMRARCDSCVSGQEQIARATAHERDIKIFAAKTTKADPADNPIVQITGVALPNDGKSFTTADTENKVGLRARILPENTYPLSAIAWSVESAPGSYMDSGRPSMAGYYGPTNELQMRLTSDHGGIPVEDTGRPQPLKYQITASASIPGKAVLSAHRVIAQDEIDKCRQEYIDWGEDLRRELPNAARSKFRVGIAGDFDRYKDCYANIYPSISAQKAFDLQNAGQSLRITTGYRSPRFNMLDVQSSTSSPHLFGDALDIVPTGSLPSDWQEIWEAPHATCPKVLEYDRRRTILYCGSDGIMRRGSMFPAGVISLNDPRVFSIQKNCIHFGELRH